ncbi:MAG: response regulator transcription factor [Angelakisella sp.]|nr:response regulator transcription factor [Angelakisella sp.]
MRVLIVDDEPSIVNLIRMNLKLEGYDTICAFTGKEAIELYSAHKPDIVLLDIFLPDMDGYDVLRSIQEIDHSAAVIFITANDKRTSKILGLELGADDYITKPFDNKELVLRVKTLWRRISLTKDTIPQVAAPEKTVFGQLVIDEDGRKVQVQGQEVTLTFREFDMLCYLIHNRKRVIKRMELLENIWGYSYLGNSRSVDILIKRLRDKLGPCGDYVKTCYGVGYRFELPEGT